MNKTSLERFSEKFIIDEENGCFQWMAYKNKKGYGCFGIEGTSVLAYRWIWEEVVEPIQEGLQLDHLCRNKGCVNPDHLEPVTPKENAQRALPYYSKFTGSHNKSHCINGHEYTEENTYINPKNRKICKICRRAADSRRKPI